MKHLRLNRSIWASTVFLSVTIVPLLGAQGRCSLTFGVNDEFGISSPYKVTSFRGSDGKEYQTQFAKLTIRQIPCIRYSYVLTRSDVNNLLGDIKGDVLLRSEHQWLTVNPDRNLSIGPTGAMVSDVKLPDNFAIRGRVRPGPLSSSTPMAIRLFQIFGRESIEVTVDSDGSYSFSKPLVGQVFVVVTQGGRLQGSAVFSITDATATLPDIVLSSER